MNREELKRRCREKRKAQRNGGGSAQLSQRLQNDPTAAMLELGIDDPTVLRSASELLSNPQKTLALLRETMKDASASSRPTAVSSSVANAEEQEDEEEAPPDDVPPSLR